MSIFVIFALDGVLAQMVDGTLDMGYGVTATTVLLAVGTAPAAASAAVHFAKVGTALASGAAHTKFGNVDWPVVTRIALPGALGALLGAFLLSSLSADVAAPWVAVVLVLLGGYVLARFQLPGGRGHGGPARAAELALPRAGRAGRGFRRCDRRWWLGSGGHVVAALQRQAVPRKVVGSVNTAEFVVAVAASLGFLLALSDEEISWLAVAGLLAGGVVAAPFAAWLVRAMPARLLGTAAGGMIVLTNIGTLLAGVGVSGAVLLSVHLMLAAVWMLALAAAVRSLRRDRAEAAALAAADTETAASS